MDCLEFGGKGLGFSEGVEKEGVRVDDVNVVLVLVPIFGCIMYHLLFIIHDLFIFGFGRRDTGESTLR